MGDSIMNAIFERNDAERAKNPAVPRIGARLASMAADFVREVYGREDLPEEIYAAVLKRARDIERLEFDDTEAVRLKREREENRAKLAKLFPVLLRR